MWGPSGAGWGSLTPDNSSKHGHRLGDGQNCMDSWSAPDLLTCLAPGLGTLKLRKAMILFSLQSLFVVSPAWRCQGSQISYWLRWLRASEVCVPTEKAKEIQDCFL